MTPRPKFLCVCRYGHSRSVALSRVLHANGHEAAAVGHFTSPSALAALAGWADVIAVLDRDMLAAVPPEHRHKATTHFHVGHDVWVNPYHPELGKLLTSLYGTYRPEAP